jgi:glycosyltransferase involved in cell wall biosynthesis
LNYTKHQDLLTDNMNILFYCPHYKPKHNKGDTAMLHNIVTYLQREHECTVMCKSVFEPYMYDGVMVIPRQSSAFQKHDLIICQLDVIKEVVAIAKGKPIIWIMHNTFDYPTIDENEQIGVVYNSLTAKAMKLWANDSFVLPPPIDYDHYNGPTGEHITLINCNENKGGKIVHEIAKRMPEYKFLQVIGSYGTQYVSTDEPKPEINMDNYAIPYGLGELPNVTVLNNMDDIRSVYSMTKILLMPSEYESWGMTATEAMCSGIPVICSTAFGLKENVGKNGIFVERNNIEKWIMEIIKLHGKKEYQTASDNARKRAIELTDGKKLEAFGLWIKKFVNKHKNV